MHELELSLRLATAGILGAFVGFERKTHLKDAGMRTHFILAVGSALIMIVSKYGFTDMYGLASISFDPSRIAAQVVSGVGFLGAGIIIFRRNVVVGLTTAAGLWATAGIGLAAGAGLYLIAIMGTVLILIGLTVLKSLERRFIGRVRSVVIISVDRVGLVNDLESLIHQSGFKLERMSINHVESGEAHVEVEAVLRAVERGLSTDTLRRSLADLEGVQQVEIPNILSN